MEKNHQNYFEYKNKQTFEFVEAYCKYLKNDNKIDSVITHENLFKKYGALLLNELPGYSESKEKEERLARELKEAQRNWSDISWMKGITTLNKLKSKKLFPSVALFQN